MTPPICCIQPFARLEGIQRTDGIGLKLVTCTACGNTRGTELSPLPLVRASECMRIIEGLAERDDLTGRERVRRIRMVIEEWREAMFRGRFSTEGMVAS